MQYRKPALVLVVVALVSGSLVAQHAGDPGLDPLLLKATAYVAMYQREVSSVVLEEEYLQTAGERRLTLTSDLLLVRPANGSTWVSFRDVFKVNGEKVRDRDDRLKTLFLAHPNVAESKQLDAIKAESSRYNIGEVVRNVNVPLFALRVLEPKNRVRFAFALGRRGRFEGVEVRRLEYSEVARPTLLTDRRGKDNVPLTGWFSIDPSSGAVTESSLNAAGPDVSSRTLVRFRREAALGLWIPSEMDEAYYSGHNRLLIRAHASYRNLRRFQVSTEEKATIPK